MQAKTNHTFNRVSHKQADSKLRAFKKHELLADWQRIVIKVGSSLIAPQGNGCSTQSCLAIAHFIQQCLEENKQVILVSSGSVAAGRNVLNIHGHLSLAQKQAMAAIGQSQVINHWQRFFDIPCAQILLTRDDFKHKNRMQNASNTLNELLALGALPVINENDSVAVEELCIGDNDNLAADVAVLAKADVLLMCSDIAGLYDDNPRTNSNAQFISEVSQITAKVHRIAGDAHHSYATGGMRTKIQAAEKATKAGINTLITNGQSGRQLGQLLEGYNIGTLFHRKSFMSSQSSSHLIGYQMQVQIS
jgi:glutamate 5-kinase